MTKYSFTYKLNTKAEPEEADYAQILRLLHTKGNVIDFVYEFDSKGKLHIHGAVEFTKKPFFATMCPKGFHSRFDRIESEEDLAKWLAYIYKDKRKHNDDQIRLSSEYYRKVYAFDEIQKLP